jgi:hypothetical protein
VLNLEFILSAYARAVKDASGLTVTFLRHTTEVLEGSPEAIAPARKVFLLGERTNVARL